MSLFGGKTQCFGVTKFKTKIGTVQIRNNHSKGKHGLSGHSDWLQHTNRVKFIKKTDLVGLKWEHGTKNCLGIKMHWTWSGWTGTKRCSQ